MKDKYEIGDTVRIMAYDKINELRSSNSEYYYSCADEKFVKSQNRIVTIAWIDESSMHLRKPDGNVFQNYTPIWVIEGYAFEYGEIIEVSDDNKTWRTRRFLAYTPKGKTVVFRDVDEAVTYWIYARPIREPEPAPLPLRELTLPEIADKFGIKLEQLRIRK